MPLCSRFDFAVIVCVIAFVLDLIFIATYVVDSGTLSVAVAVAFASDGLCWCRRMGRMRQVCASVRAQRRGVDHGHLEHLYVFRYVFLFFQWV